MKRKFSAHDKRALKVCVLNNCLNNSYVTCYTNWIYSNKNTTNNEHLFNKRKQKKYVS